MIRNSVGGSLVLLTLALLMGSEPLPTIDSAIDLRASAEEQTTRDEESKKQEKETRPATEKVISEGAGLTADEALKDAFRNAVRQVVGAVVDAETVVKNDDLISDKVLTYSAGFIKKYEELSKKEEKGLFRIKITAEVERRILIAKLTAAKINVREIDGKGLFAEAVTKAEAQKKASELLKKRFSEMPSLIVAEVVSKPEFDKSSSELLLDVAIKVDRKAYTAYLNDLDELLKKVAIRQTSTILEATPHRDSARTSTGFLHNLIYKPFVGPAISSKESDAWCIWINTFENANHTTTKWSGYVIDSNMQESLEGLLGRNSVTLSVRDKDGGLITEKQFELKSDQKATYSTSWYPDKGALLPLLWHMTPRTLDRGFESQQQNYVNDLLGQGDRGKDYATKLAKNMRINLFICPNSFTVKASMDFNFGGTAATIFYQPEVILKQRVKVSLDELKKIDKVECKLSYKP